MFTTNLYEFFFGASGPHNYNLVASAGTYAVNGVANQFKFSRSLTSSSGTYNVTGVAATLASGETANTGSYTVNGIAASLNVNRVITASTGAYSVNGVTATLGAGLNANVGTYNVSGVAAKAVYTISPSFGTYNVNGSAATLTYTPFGTNTYILTANVGSYVVAGISATVTYKAGSSSNDGIPRNYQGWTKHKHSKAINKLIKDKVDDRLSLREQLEKLYFKTENVSDKALKITTRLEDTKEQNTQTDNKNIIDIKKRILLVDQQLLEIEHKARVRRSEEEIIALIIH